MHEKNTDKAAAKGEKKKKVLKGPCDRKRSKKDESLELEQYRTEKLVQGLKQTQTGIKSIC